MASKNDVLEALRQVEDPELGMDIVDLGLVYEVEVEGTKAKVLYSLTSMGCPAGPLIAQDIDRAAREVPGVDDVGEHDRQLLAVERCDDARLGVRDCIFEDRATGRANRGPERGQLLVGMARGRAEHAEKLQPAVVARQQMDRQRPRREHELVR